LLALGKEESWLSTLALRKTGDRYLQRNCNDLQKP